MVDLEERLRASELKVQELESQLGIYRESDGREVRLGVTGTRVEELRALALTAGTDAHGAALKDAVRFYDLVRKAWEVSNEEYNELDHKMGNQQATIERLDRQLAEAKEQVRRGEDLFVQRGQQINAVEAAWQARVDEAITWLVTVNPDQPASIIAGRAQLALKALRDG